MNLSPRIQNPYEDERREPTKPLPKDADGNTLVPSAEALAVDLDRLARAIDKAMDEKRALLAVVKDFVELYNGVEDILGPNVRAKIERAKAALLAQ